MKNKFFTILLSLVIGTSLCSTNLSYAEDNSENSSSSESTDITPVVSDGSENSFDNQQTEESFNAEEENNGIFDESQEPGIEKPDISEPEFGVGGDVIENPDISEPEFGVGGDVIENPDDNINSDKVCSICGKGYELTSNIPATCTSGGSYTLECKDCGIVKKANLAALGHSYSVETISEEALKSKGDCLTPAVYYKSCERCGDIGTDDKDTFNGDVGEHNYIDGVCSICEKTNYTFTHGSNSVFSTDSNDGITVRVDAPFERLTGVKVDDQLISSDNYTIAKGSTIITLKPDFLKTLSPGNHTLTAVYDNGEVSTGFQVKSSSSIVGKPDKHHKNPNLNTQNKNTKYKLVIKNKINLTSSNNQSNNKKVDTSNKNYNTQNEQSVRTGDNTNILIYGAPLLLSGIALIAILVYRKKTKSSL